MPVLKNHNRDLILGYTTRFSLKDQVMVEGTFLESSDEAKKVITMADEGYPWQMSLNAYSDEEQYLERNLTAEVNGQTVKGPIVICWKSTIREVSFCAVGADSGTNARVFSIGKSNLYLPKAMSTT
jgi:hypothetical protein